MSLLSRTTHRPRNLDSLRAAGILYGDLGTSKAYVIGLALALAGFSSFWIIAAVSLLVVIVGINYTTICRCYPHGGGVYSSCRRRSPALSMIGAFFLMADFFVTAALSALSAFSYLQVADPVMAAAIAIAVIGLLNYLGPRHTGSLAFITAIAAVIILTILVMISFPQIGQAWQHIRPLSGSKIEIWKNFVGVIVALSGIEAIANATGIMKLNPGTSHEKPVVTRTSTRAILVVIAEVSIYTCFFGFVVAALPGLEIRDDSVFSPGGQEIRDYILRYMSDVFAAPIFGTQLATIFGWTLSIIIGILLLSAVNTAINGMIALQYVMSGDGEMPHHFEKLNRFGVPLIPLIIATVIPIALVIGVEDIAGLASLYAIGFVGAIMTNFGATSTDFSLDLRKWERTLMFFSFLIMVAIEITLFIDKPGARYFCLSIIIVGLALREVAKKLRKGKPAGPIAAVSIPQAELPPILCVGHKPGRALDFAFKKSKETGQPLYLLFVREQKVITEKDLGRTWEQDRNASLLFESAKKMMGEENFHYFYSISDSAPDIIVAYALLFNSKQIIVDTEASNRFLMLLRGRLVKRIRRRIGDDVELIYIDGSPL